jgi:hypothetical protein
VLSPILKYGRTSESGGVAVRESDDAIGKERGRTVDRGQRQGGAGSGAGLMGS